MDTEYELCLEYPVKRVLAKMYKHNNGTYLRGICPLPKDNNSRLHSIHDDIILYKVFLKNRYQRVPMLGFTMCFECRSW